MVTVKDLSLDYAPKNKKTIAALSQVNAEFETGAISVIAGPSGCGKTSLIKIIAGLQKPSAGTVSVEGEAVLGVKKNTAVIFQDYGLLPWKTVMGNAQLPMLFSGEARFQRAARFPWAARFQRARRQRYEKAAFLLAKFGLKGFEKAYPGELSGGMKQRLAIVRALLMQPKLLLMDEPFSSLDNVTREEAQDFFLSVREELQLTIIMISHSIEEAVYLADSIYVMTGRNPGTIGHCIHISREGESHSRFRESSRFNDYCSSLRKLLRPGADGRGQNAEKIL